MPVSLYALFRRAASASFKPDGAPLADRKTEISHVRHAVWMAKKGWWGDASFALAIDKGRIYGTHAGAVNVRAALEELRSLAMASNHIWGLPGCGLPSVPALAVATREDVTAAYPLADALEEVGLDDFRARVDVVIAAYEKHFPRGK